MNEFFGRFTPDTVAAILRDLKIKSFVLVGVDDTIPCANPETCKGHRTTVVSHAIADDLATKLVLEEGIDIISHEGR